VLPTQQDDGLLLSEIEQVALRPGKADEIIVRGYGITLRRQIC